MVKRFFTGFGFIFTGHKMQKQVPGIGLWIFLPWLIDLAIFGGGLLYGFSHFRGWAQSATYLIFKSADSQYFDFVFYPILFLFIIVFSALFFFFMYLIAGFIASPFYMILTEKIYKHQVPAAVAPAGFAEFLKRSIHMMFVSLIRLILLSLLGVLLFAASFVPILNLISTYFVFVLLALDSADYAFETLGFNLRQRFNFFRENSIEFFGMGAFMALTAMLPGLILLVMPYAVMGATQIVLNKNKASLENKAK